MNVATLTLLWVIDWNYQPTVNEATRLGNLRCYDSGGRNGLIELHQQHVLKIEGSFLDDVLSVGDELVDMTITRMRPVIEGWTKLWVEFLDSRPLPKISPTSEEVGCGRISGGPFVVTSSMSGQRVYYECCQE